MPGLSIGAYIAWQYAAGEAAEAGHPYIEARHVFLGILSLDKALLDREGPELRWNEREELRLEANLVRQVFDRLGVESAKLRREFRAKIGQGSHLHGGDIVHRSQRCRAVFARSQALAGQENSFTALHLLSVLAEEGQEGMSHLLREVGILPGELLESVRSYMSFVEPGSKQGQQASPPASGRAQRASKVKSKSARAKNG
jgi:ATP-dependent Clp protease ATP-binding subunit ClpC